MAEPWESDPIAAPWDADPVVKPAMNSEADVGQAALGVPEAFLDRVRAGQALTRITRAAIAEGGEATGGQTPTGFSDETLHHLIDLGIFHDPEKGRPGPIQFANEALMMPTAQAWQGITTAINSGIHGAGGAFGQIVEEFGGSQGTANRAKNDVINAGNWAMIEGGMSRFSRPSIVKDAQAASDARGPVNRVLDQTVGGLPRPEDFSNAAKVMDSPNAEANLKRMWSEDGIHPAEAVHDAETDAFLRNEITKAEEIKPDPETEKVMQETGGNPGSLSAALTPPEDVPLNVQPARPAGSLIASVQNAAEKLFDLGRDIQMKLTPMARGSTESMATVKDYMNTMRRNAWDSSRIDTDIANRFSPEQRQRMAQAMEEESLSLREPASAREHQGLATLEPDERQAVLDLDTAQQMAWLRARESGVVEGDGIPMHFPRMAIGAKTDSEIGKPASLTQMYGIRKNSPYTKQRQYVEAQETERALKAKYGNQAKIAWDIRAVNLATKMLEDATAGRSLINNIEDVGKRTGEEAVAVGWKPGDGWFTVDHPAFQKTAIERKQIEIPGGQGASANITHEAGFDPVLQKGLERVASELGVKIRQPLRSEDPYLSTNPTTMGYTSRAGNDVVSTFGNAQTILEHEIGHKIDFRYDLSHKIHDQSIKAWQELGELALHRIDKNSRLAIRGEPDFLKKISSHDPYTRIGSYGDYLLSGEERIANFLHAYWYAPKLLEQVAPNALKWFDNFLNEAPDSLKRAIKDVQPGLQVATERKMQTSSVMSLPQTIEVTQNKTVPIYVRSDFEGPIRSALWGKSGETYKGLMALKGKTMGLIMNSPAIHNLVEFGRAFPAMPTRIVKAYFDGYRAKQDPAVMHEAIDAGLVPIGKRFFNQDIDAIMESPDLTPGRSLTAKTLALVPGLFDEAAGTAVKRAIDKAGDFWHNTLLWDRVADLQMGLYTNFRGDMVNKGMDVQTASRVAAHLANRYAGALPKEAMSEAATKVSNFLFFSRSFTFGNLGVMKDMLTGLPKDVIAQIERDSGFRAGAINEAGELAGPAEDAVKFAKGMARRKAMMTIGLDIALMYAGNSVLQNAFNVLRGSSVSEEEHGYWTRAKDLLNEGSVHPLSLLNPFHVAERLSATSNNEPGRGERVLVGYAKDGTAIYARNPVGKIGEEFTNYFSSPIDMFRKKEGTIARPLLQILSNDAGFGRKIYDPNADTPAAKAGSIWAIVKHLVGSQLPEGQISALSDLIKGEGDAKVNALQAFGPLAGVTFSRGAPGGPAVGEMYANKSKFEFQVNQAMPDIRRQILRGDSAGALQRMQDLGMDGAYSRWVLKTTQNPATRLGPRAMRDFYRTATPEQRAKMTGYQQTPQQP